MPGSRIDWSEYLEARVDDQVERMDRDHGAFQEALEVLKTEQARIAATHKLAAWLTALIATSAIALGTWLVRTTLVLEERSARAEHIASETAQQLRALSQAVARIEGKLE